MTYEGCQAQDAQLSAANPSFPLSTIAIGQPCKSETGLDFQDAKAPTYVVLAHHRGRTYVRAVYPDLTQEDLDLPGSMKVCRA